MDKDTAARSAVLRTAYGDLSNLAGSLTEREAWLSTGCTGWSVRDLVFHLLADAQRGLVALAVPVEGSPDRDAVTYWTDAPSGDDPSIARSARSGRWPVPIGLVRSRCSTQRPLAP